MPNAPWLVATDFSPASLAALRWTTAHFAPADALVAVHVVDIAEPPSFLAPLMAPAAPAREIALDGARARCERLRAEVSPQLGFEVRAGRAVSTLVAVAQERHAAAIVLGPHGRRPGLGRFIGSTASRVAQLADCPVVVARGDLGVPPARILVAVQDTPASLAALDWAAQMASAPGRELVALHVLDPVLSGAVQMGGTGRERRVALDKLEQASQRWIEERVAATTVDATRRLGVLRIGDPIAEILAAIESFDADLLVIGRGRRGFAGLAGNVADALLRAAQVSTVVVP